MPKLLRIGTKVVTIDRYARVHGRPADKPESVGVVRDYYRPFGRQSKDKKPPYFVEFDGGFSAWYDEQEVEPFSAAGKRSAAKIEDEIADELAKSES